MNMRAFPGLIIAALLTACASPQVSEAEARAEYEKIVALISSSEYNVRHILVESKSQAATALNRIRAGESFGSVARELSQDPGSAPQGGELGWNDPRNFVPEFSKAMITLTPNGMTKEPVRSPFGWHIIEVNEIRKAAVPPFEEVQDKIVSRLKKRKAAVANN